VYRKGELHHEGVFLFLVIRDELETGKPVLVFGLDDTPAVVVRGRSVRLGELHLFL